MTIQDLKEKQNLFGKLVAKSKANMPITTYGYIREVNCTYITFEDSADPKLKYKVHSVVSFTPEEFKNKFV
jgi:hypothetical protein